MNSVNPGELLAGRYRILERIPTDVLQLSVWKSRDQILDRAVRVSILDGDHRADALDSARRAALVHDRRLLRILDVGAVDELSYVVTEPAAGQKLSEIVAAGIVDPQQARAIVGEAASALEQARERGVHHLAIRPGAIQVDGSKVLVTGLGVDAGVAGLDQRDPQATSRADVHCLVAVLYYLMTARWPGPSLDVSWIDPHAIHPLGARRRDGAVVSIAEIRGDVPSDLVDLCEQTFAGHDGNGERWDRPTDAGPASVAELIERLHPWVEVSIVAALPEFVQSEPGIGVNRQSVRMAFGSSTVPPGTPPPAPPIRPSGRIHRPVAGAPPTSTAGPGPASPSHGEPSGVPTPASVPRPPIRVAHTVQAPSVHVIPAPIPAPPSAVSIAGQGPVLPNTPSPQPVAPTGGSPAPAAPTAAPAHGRFNPTAIILILALIAVVAGIVWAIGTAFQGFNPPIENRNQSVETPADTSSADESDDGGDSAVDTGPLQIASGEALDPEGLASGDTAGEHPETAARAIDGDPATIWATRTYKSAQFGRLKSGVGYAITLENPAKVSGFTLVTGNTGGHVEVRATTPDQPTSGDVIASGPLAATTELTFAAPAEGQVFVLWFSELPQAGDGGYRVEIGEIAVQ